MRKGRGSVQFKDQTDIVPPSELEYLMFMHEEEGRSAEQEEEEEEPPQYDRRLSLSYKDSLTRLLSQTSFHDGTLAQELEDILKVILEELASGKLNNDQIKDLIDIARNILDSLQMLSSHEESQGTLTPVMISSPTSQTSVMAREIVQQTLERVKQELLADSEFLELSGKDVWPAVSPARTLSSLAEFIVNKAVTSAVHSLQAVSSEEEVLRPKPRTPGRPTSAPATPRTHQLPDVIQEEPPFQVKTAESELVWTVLRRTAKEVESEIMKANPTKEPSQMSTFVKHVLSQAAQELVSRASGRWVDWSRNQSQQQVDSAASDISYFVQYTISKVLRDMEEEGLIPVTDKQSPKSASSLFVENLVDITLQQCLDELNEELLPKTDLVSVAAAIIESHQELKTSSSVDKHSAFLTKSLSNTYQEEKDVTKQSSMLVEAFVKETLNKVLTDLKGGKMSMEEVHVLALAFSKISDQDAATSLEAQHFVEEALENVLQELLPGSTDYETMHRKTEFETEPFDKVEAVEKAFDEVIDELHKKSLPVKSQSSAELEHFIKAVLTSVKKEISQIIKTHTLDDRSNSDQRLELFINDLIDKNATDLAEQQGFQYQHTSTPSLNILICETPKVSSESVEDTSGIQQTKSVDLESTVTAMPKGETSDSCGTNILTQSPSMKELDSFINKTFTESYENDNPDIHLQSASKLENQDEKRLDSKFSEELNAFISSIIRNPSGEISGHIIHEEISAKERKERDMDKSNQMVSMPSRQMQTLKDNLKNESSGEMEQKDESVPLKQEHRVIPSENKDTYIDSSKELGSLISKIMTQSIKEIKKVDSENSGGSSKVYDTASIARQAKPDNISTNINISQPRTPNSSVVDIKPSSKISTELSAYIKMVITDAAENLVKNVMSSALISKEDIETKTAINDLTGVAIQREEESVKDEDSEETSVTATFHDRPISLDHGIIENALAVISVKKDHDLHHIHHYDAVPRNSFLSLQHPEIEKVKRLSHHVGSDEDVCKKILSLSSKCTEVLKHNGESSESSSESESSSGSEELPESAEMIISVVDIHNSVAEKDSQETITKLAKLEETVGVSSSSTIRPYATKLSKAKDSAAKNNRTSKSSSVSVAKKSSNQIYGSSSIKKAPSQSYSAKQDSAAKIKTKSLISPLQKSSHSTIVKSNDASTSCPRIKEKKESYEMNRRKSTPVKVISNGNHRVVKKGVIKEHKSDVSSNASSSLKKLSKGSNMKDMKQSNNPARRVSDKKSDTDQMDKSATLSTLSNRNSETHQKSQSAAEIQEKDGIKSTENLTVVLDGSKTDSFLVSLSDTQENGDESLFGIGTNQDILNEQLSEEQTAFISTVTEKGFSNLDTKDTENNTSSQLNCSTSIDLEPDVIPKGKDQFVQFEKTDEVFGCEKPNTKEPDVENTKSSSIAKLNIESNFSKELHVKLNSGSAVDDLGEIEEEIQPTRRTISAKKSSRTSQLGYFPTSTLSDKDIKPKSNTIEMVSSFPKSLKKGNSSDGGGSCIKSKRSSSSNHRTPHETLSLTPRPSSGFSKSPTPFSMTQCDSGLNPVSSGVSVASRIIKSISSLGEKILGRKSPSIDAKSTTSDNAQSAHHISGRASTVTLPEISSNNTKEISTSNNDSASKKSKSSKTTLDEISKTASLVSLSPKQSQSNLSANNSVTSDVHPQTLSACYTHSEPDEEDMLSSKTQTDHSHLHTIDPLSTGSLPDLGSQSYAMIHRTHTANMKVTQVDKITAETVATVVASQLFRIYQDFITKNNFIFKPSVYIKYL